MATKAIAAAPEAASVESAKIQDADRQTETQAVDQTTQPDVTTGGNAPLVAGEPQQDAEHISPASAEKKIGSQVPSTADRSDDSSPSGVNFACKAPIMLLEGEFFAAKRSQDLVSNDSGSQPPALDSPEHAKPHEGKVESISRATLSNPDSTMERSFPAPPADTSDSADGPIATAPGKADAMATEGGQVGTLSASDKVTDAVVPSWTTFADLTLDQKFDQARLMGFEVRDKYLRERCRAATLEVASAASALDRATAIIETNFPFFLVHFEDMDAQGERSDLKGKVVGKTEWLQQNMPNLSKGTFYAALKAVKARYTEQQRMMLGGEVPPAPQPRTRTNALTPLQSEVAAALVGQGFKNKDAVSMVTAAEGTDFDSLFRSAQAQRAGTPPPVVNPPAPNDKTTPPRADELPVGEESTGEESAPEPPQSEEPDEHEESTTEIEPDALIAELKKQVARLQNEAELANAEIRVLTGENENLRQRLTAINAVPEELRDDTITSDLAAEPDTDVAGKRLTAYQASVANRVLPPNMALKDISAHVEIAGRSSRIMANDFLEKRNNPPMPPTLCKCSTEISDAGRKKVIEWADGKWGKSHVIYSSDETDYRVITEAAARLLAPAAFGENAPAEPGQKEGL